MDEMLKTIFEGIVNGDANAVKENVGKAVEAGLSAEDILKKGLVPAMAEVGDLFERSEFFVPEMLIAARAMQGGLAILKPLLASSDVQSAGTVVIATVAGDLHDIGKNLVGMMMEGAGFEIVDLGTDASPEQFVDAVKEHSPEIVAMSALLTTTMPSMQNTILALEEAGLRDQVKVIIGGAPLTDDFASDIGADGFAMDASRAATLAKKLVE